LLSRLGKELGVDPNAILATSHGRRSIDVLKLYDKEKAKWECKQIQRCRQGRVAHAHSLPDISYIEGLIPIEFGQDAVEVPGARRLLSVLDLWEVPWAVVTSGTRALADGWIRVMKLAHPKHMVVAEDVDNGKPDPACYLLGRRRLGFKDEKELLVIEDAPSGIKAGKAAGFKVVGLATTHDVDQVKNAGADWIIQDLRSLVLKGYTNGLIEIEIRNGLMV
jgi:glycerol-1-phosphatase